jgi:hypothetical protein
MTPAATNTPGLIEQPTRNQKEKRHTTGLWALSVSRYRLSFSCAQVTDKLPGQVLGERRRVTAEALTGLVVAQASVAVPQQDCCEVQRSEVPFEDLELALAFEVREQQVLLAVLVQKPICQGRQHATPFRLFTPKPTVDEAIDVVVSRQARDHVQESCFAVHLAPVVEGQKHWKVQKIEQQLEVSSTSKAVLVSTVVGNAGDKVDRNWNGRRALDLEEFERSAIKLEEFAEGAA